MVEIAAGDAHEAAALRIVDGMDGADVVDAGMAGFQPVALNFLELGLAFSLAAIESRV